MLEDVWWLVTLQGDGLTGCHHSSRDVALVARTNQLRGGGD